MRSNTRPIGPRMKIDSRWGKFLGSGGLLESFQLLVMVSDTCIQIYNSTLPFEKGIPKNQDRPATSSTTSSTLREPLRTLSLLVVPDGGLEFRAAAAVFELPLPHAFTILNYFVQVSSFSRRPLVATQLQPITNLP